MESPYKLNYSRRRLTDAELQHMRRELPKQDTFEEIDFSMNEFTSKGLSVVLEVCKRCPKLKVLKLYKNQIDDGGAQGLAELCKACPAIEEMHLSHNHFTALGVEVLITAAEQARPAHISPLWLRLEQNDVSDPDAVFRDLQSRPLSVCKREDEKYCTVRVCCKKHKVHLPFFHLQRLLRHQDNRPGIPAGHGPVQMEGPSYRVPRPAEASPAVRASPVAMNGAAGGGNAWGMNGSAARRLAGVPDAAEAAAEKPPAWGSSGLPAAAAGGNSAETGAAPEKTEARAHEGSSTAPAAQPSPPTANAARTAASPVAVNSSDGAGGAMKSEAIHLAGGQRPSLLLDSSGRRRIHPKQLEDNSSGSQFICCLCHLVMLRPVITSCSHLFCEGCFRNWVAEQVNNMKKNTSGDSPVPLIPCPTPSCTVKLRKKDIMPMAQVDAQDGAVVFLKRLQRTMRVRCVHHVDHFTLPFGKDAEQVSLSAGVTCKWAGDLMDYEEHVGKGCPVESHIGGPAPRGMGEASVGGSSEMPAQSPASAASPSPQAAPAATAQPASTPKAAPAAQQPFVPAARSHKVESPKVGAVAGEAAPAPQPAQTAETSAEPQPQAENLPMEDLRVAKHDYNPTGSDKSQISLKKDDLVKIFEVTASGWAAGVKISRETRQELGDAGWFPAGYLYPPNHRIN